VGGKQKKGHTHTHSLSHIMLKFLIHGLFSLSLSLSLSLSRARALSLSLSRTHTHIETHRLGGRECREQGGTWWHIGGPVRRRQVRKRQQNGICVCAKILPLQAKWRQILKSPLGRDLHSKHVEALTFVSFFFLLIGRARQAEQGTRRHRVCRRQQVLKSRS